MQCECCGSSYVFYPSNKTKKDGTYLGIFEDSKSFVPYGGGIALLYYMMFYAFFIILIFGTFSLFFYAGFICNSARTLSNLPTNLSTLSLQSIAKCIFYKI